jgi:hypothetical protein
MLGLTNTEPATYHMERTRVLLELPSTSKPRARHAPDHPEAHRLLAAVLWGQGKLARARSAAERALGLAPQVAAFHVRYAWFLLSKRTTALAWPKTLEAAQREAETDSSLIVQKALLWCTIRAGGIHDDRPGSVERMALDLAVMVGKPVIKGMRLT